MREKYWLYFGLELLLAAASVVAGYSGVELISLIICSLILACLLTAKLLAQLLDGPPVLAWVVAVAVLVIAFIFNAQVILPLFAVLLLEAFGERTEQRYAVALAIIASMLVFIVIPQLLWSLVLALIGLAVASWGSYILQKLCIARKILDQKDHQLIVLEVQLSNQRETIAAIEQQGRQAERNRLAARIHDQIGHGVTGSVLMLEAAMIQLDKNPDAARSSIEQATENLRTSVDGIRAELREERAVHQDASLARITQELTRFESEHPLIRTELVVEGSLEDVSQAIWICINEALRETLTNLLKHSNARYFKVLISQKNRLVYAEFSDNGTQQAGSNPSVIAALSRNPVTRKTNGNDSPSTTIITGIGLQSIEERCLLCGGKCFFCLTPHGFITKMTFTLKERQAI